jgi:hypothetical protein
MSDPNVKISGFNTSELGEKDVTVTYKGKSTKFAINVVERLRVSNVETDYFVGDSFNKNKGQVLITKDDGSFYKVAMSDSTISVSSYNFSTANDKSPVTIRYRGLGRDYTGTFNVVVHNVASAELTEPEQLTYEDCQKIVSATKKTK